MAIVERNVSTTRTTSTRPDIVVENTSDATSGLLVILGIIVAFAAAYFLYDYYYSPVDQSPTVTSTTTINNPGATSTMTPAEEPVSRPDTTVTP